MRILFVGHQASKEGAGRFLLDEVDYLQKRGVSVYAVLPSQGPLGESLLELGVKPEIIGFPWWCHSPGNKVVLEREALLRGAQKIATLAQARQVDLIYTHTLASPVGALAAVFAGLPHVWHIHEFAHEPENIEVVIPPAELHRFVDLTSNLIVFNSKAVAREWEGALNPDKTALVYNWITSNTNPRTESVDSATPALLQTLVDRFVIIQLGSVNVPKHQEDAIEAVARLVADGCNAALLIVGPIINDAYYRSLLDLVQRHQLEKRVHFVGYTETPEEWFRLADVSVVCSPKEPFGRVTIESMHHGLPVVGAAAAGTAEIIQDGVNGFLFPPRDSSMLAARLRQLADSVESRETMGKNARQRAQDFCSAATQMDPLIKHLEQFRGGANPLASVSSLVSPAIAILAQNDGRTMPLADLVRQIARRVSRRLGFRH